MSNPVARAKALSLTMVWMLTASLLVGLSSWFAPPAAAQNCARTGAPTPGDWVVGPVDVQVCQDIVVVMDGNLIVQGSLTIVNGGVKFVEDTSHIYSISVAAGGTLALDNSKIWTETNLVNPYLKLAVTISGTFVADASTLAFPGTFASTAGSTVTFRNGSLVRMTEGNVAAVWLVNSPTWDDNNDGPGLTFTSSTVYFYDSRVENLYENGTTGFTGDPRQHIRLEGTTSFTAVDTFLAVDFCCVDVNASVDTHNRLALTGTSNAYLYGVNFDVSENPATQDLWVTAITTVSGSEAYVYRWADVRVIDVNGVPVPGAQVDAFFSGAQTGLANFTETGATTPPANILAYLNKTATTWDDTGADGTARMPLITDWIDPSTGGNSRFVGTFTIDATLAPHTGSSPLTFAAYPSMDSTNTSKSVTVRLSTLSSNLPDLTPNPPTFTVGGVQRTAKEDETVDISAPIANVGLGGAANVLVRILDGTTLLFETVIPFIGAGGQVVVLTSLPNATGGQHVIRVSVDPDPAPNGAIVEGPGALAEANNLKGYQLPVTPFGPDLDTDVSFNPDPGFLNNPIELIAGVTNLGDGNASDILINFYVQGNQPTDADTPIGTATLPFLDIGAVATASVNWTPTSLATFRVWAWADPDPPNTIPEPDPYSEANNLDFNDIRVEATPDLVTFDEDLTLTDPFPRVGQSINLELEAVVRNDGQNSTGGFVVQFAVDGVPVAPTRSNGVGLLPGERWTVPPVPIPAFTSCGAHTIGIYVDSTNVVVEGTLYEQNNVVTKPVQVYPGGAGNWVTWSGGTIDADVAVSSSIEITGAMTIQNGQVSVVQDQDSCGRYYVKVLDGGSLSLVNSGFTSNWPLVVFVAPGVTGASLTATNSTFDLDVQGRGVLHSKGTLTMWDSEIRGDLIAKGTRADLRGDTFRGGLLHIDTAQMSRIWDSTLPGVQTIQLTSDAPGTVSVDYDIRNVTFNAALTSQIHFSGDQVVQLTSVQLSKPGDWWAGMLAQTAHVTRYWWLTVQTVDGTGTVFDNPTTVIGLARFNPASTVWDVAPVCAVDDCFFNTNTTWPIGAPTGTFLYRAAAEDRYGSLPPSVRASYRASGSTVVEGTLRLPDGDVSALLTSDTTITLVFSELTPNLRILSIQFNGDNGVNVDVQPVNRQLLIVTRVMNDGEIVTRSLKVNCYSTAVDVGPVDGFMDDTNASFAASGQYIGTATPLDVPPHNFTDFTCRWTPATALEGTITVSVVVDPPEGADTQGGGAIQELNETDNIGFRTLGAFTWPDLHLDADPVDPNSITPTTPIANNPITMNVQVRNEGTNAADAAIVGIYMTDNTPLGLPVTVNVARGATATVTISFTPTGAGNVTVRIRADTSGAPTPGDYQNHDFDTLDVPSDNWRDRTFLVRTQPELSITNSSAVTAIRNFPFTVDLTVTNAGQTAATGIVVAVTWIGDTPPRAFRGATYGVTVPAMNSIDVAVLVTNPLPDIGLTTIFATVDANQTIQEQIETDNEVPIQIFVQAPAGTIVLDSPRPGNSFTPGQQILVSGRVIATNGDGLGGVDVTVRLVNSANQVITNATTTSSTGTASNAGWFTVGIGVSSSQASGSYRVLADAIGTSVDPASVTISIQRPVGFFDAIFLGLPVWIWLIVIVGAAILIGGLTAYLKFVGLGKLVECGECGSFIPEDSRKCPKCGVEFERDMAKCSNCQAWIPVDVKQCPECGVEFVTGEVAMADYEGQMRRQYDEVKAKFRERASQELGRSLNDAEFEDWWRTQPTYLTFEDWLREEEEMRRMGSRPCPVCNTLNSVTAVVCHKCGTLLKEDSRKPGGKPPAATPSPGAAEGQAPGEAGATAGEEGAEGAPSDAIPKKVVKKPVLGAPVVQKKVIKRAVEEEKKEGEDSGVDEF